MLKAILPSFLHMGKGYYEEYQADELLSNYGLPPFNGIDTMDLVRKLWLDNNFYGSIFSFQYEKKKTILIIGGSVTKYDGKHFGEIPIPK
jgi:iron complex outermembrane receptor protein